MCPRLVNSSIPSIQTPHGVQLAQKKLLFLPIEKGLTRIQELHRRGLGQNSSLLPNLTVRKAKQSYSEALSANLGQFAVMANTERIEFVKHLLDYIEQKCSIQGLESMFLTSLIFLARSGDVNQFSRAASLWNRFRTQSELSAGYGLAIALDAASRQLSIFNRAGLDVSLTDNLQVLSGGVDLRSELAVLKPLQINLQREDFGIPDAGIWARDECKGAWILGAGIVGATIGAVIGALGGGPAGAGAGAAAGFGVGAGIGDGMSELVCGGSSRPSDDSPSNPSGTSSPKEPSSPEEPVSSGDDGSGDDGSGDETSSQGVCTDESYPPDWVMDVLTLETNIFPATVDMSQHLIQVGFEPSIRLQGLPQLAERQVFEDAGFFDQLGVLREHSLRQVAGVIASQANGRGLTSVSAGKVAGTAVGKVSSPNVINR